MQEETKVKMITGSQTRSAASGQFLPLFDLLSLLPPQWSAGVLIGKVVHNRDLVGRYFHRSLTFQHIGDSIVGGLDGVVSGHR